MKIIFFTIFSIFLIFPFSCNKKDSRNNIDNKDIINKSEEYHNRLYNFISSDAIKAVTKKKFIENQGAAGSLIEEFPGGEIESVSGYTTIKIYNDKELSNYGYTGPFYIGEKISLVINDFGKEYRDERNQLSYNSFSIIFEYDSNKIIKKIYIKPVY